MQSPFEYCIYKQYTHGTPCLASTQRGQDSFDCGPLCPSVGARIPACGVTMHTTTSRIVKTERDSLWSTQGRRRIFVHELEAS
jgi:hypothetical protein